MKDIYNSFIKIRFQFLCNQSRNMLLDNIDNNIDLSNSLTTNYEREIQHIPSFYRLSTIIILILLTIAIILKMTDGIPFCFPITIKKISQSEYF
jgi:hypothetical protein